MEVTHVEFVIMVSARVKLDTRVTRARIQHRARMDVRRMEYAFVGCAPAKHVCGKSFVLSNGSSMCIECINLDLS